MDVLTSSEFRRRYASLKAPTRVTVNGHDIGTWMPATPFEKWFDSLTDFGTPVAGDPPIIGTHGSKRTASGGFNSRPFTPVPRSGKGK
jgi:hypothetical protein